MNIFVLDANPIQAAQALCDKHVVKMCLETAQMLCTIVGGAYKPTHKHHPCVKWASATQDNFLWLVEHGLAIGEEYTYRYGKIHRSSQVIIDTATRASIIPIGKLTPFALAMPDEFQSTNPIESYREYYHTKSTFARWTKRDPPTWWRIS